MVRMRAARLNLIRSFVRWCASECKTDTEARSFGEVSKLPKVKERLRARSPTIPHRAHLRAVHRADARTKRGSRSWLLSPPHPREAGLRNPRRLHEGLLRPPGGTACTSEPPTSITSYAVPPLSKLGPVRSGLGLIPESQGERHRSRWKEAIIDRAKRILWQ
jgi:hypothetical protein